MEFQENVLKSETTKTRKYTSTEEIGATAFLKNMNDQSEKNLKKIRKNKEYNKNGPRTNIL